MKGTTLPMNSENAYIRELDSVPRPTLDTEMEALERKYFSYRKAIGELIWPMITTRVDISFPTVKLSQYSSSPAAAHYQAVKHVF